MEAVNLADLRRQAQRRLPKVIFDFVDGGAMDERTLAANSGDFAELRFRPKALVDVGDRRQTVRVLGQELSLPLVLAPTGATALFGAGGEIAAMRAANAAGAGYCVSTMATTSIEDLAAVRRGFWFQLYIQRDREVTRALVERAAAVDCPVICVTIDTVVQGRRERDLYNGFAVPPKLTPRNAWDFLTHPAWLWRMATGPRISFANFAHIESRQFDLTTIAKYIGEQFDPSLTWRDIDWLKSIWPGKVAIKGILSAADARLACEHGVDAVIVSNHGGRQLDDAVSAISALPEVVAAVGERCEVLLDGGVRRGSDVVKALALGAKACMIGRPFLYGLAAGGQAGAGRALQILRDEIDSVQALIGCPDLDRIDRAFLSLPDAPWPANR